MKLAGITYQGPSVDDAALLAELPEELQRLLRQVNGFVARRGGLHVRGACREPLWHSLREVWRGGHAFAGRYPKVRPDDVPFAQDCVGDQFVLRQGEVHRLGGETGDVEALGVDLWRFLRQVDEDPDALALEPLERFELEGGRLQPGQLLHAVPPFCMEEAANGVSLRAVPALEVIAVHAELARQIRGLDDGTSVQVRVVD